MTDTKGQNPNPPDLKKSDLFLLPGLNWATDRFIKQLKMSGPFEHVLIRGPRGAGKRYFAKVFADVTGKKPMTINCAQIHPDSVESTLFGHRKGSFTGAAENRDGLILTAYKNEQQPLFLDELNSLHPAHQSKLLVYMESGEFFPMGADKPTQDKGVRILAAMNDEPGIPPRADLLDRFQIVVDVPPLYKRRPDILAFIAQRYPDLQMEKMELMSIYAHDWPGNVRELDRVLYELRAGLELRQDLLDNARHGLMNIHYALKDAGHSDNQIRKMAYILFGGAVPLDTEGILMIRENPETADRKKNGGHPPLDKVWVAAGDHGYEIRMGSSLQKYRAVSTGAFRSFFSLIKIEGDQSADPLLNPEKFQAQGYFERSLLPPEKRKTHKHFEENLSLLVSCLQRAWAHQKQADATQKITVEQVAEFVLSPENRDGVVSACLRRLGVGGQKKLADLWGVSTTAMSRCAKEKRD